jgi:hypothetical protein
MASLTELDLLQKAALYELLKDTTPYMLHPNLWIRQATAGDRNLRPRFFSSVESLCIIFPLSYSRQCLCSVNVC